MVVREQQGSRMGDQVIVAIEIESPVQDILDSRYAKHAEHACNEMCRICDEYAEYPEYAKVCIYCKHFDIFIGQMLKLSLQLNSMKLCRVPPKIS